MRQLPAKTDRYCKLALNAFVLVAWLMSVAPFIFGAVLPFASARAGLGLLALYPVLLACSVFLYERKQRSSVPLATGYLWSIGVLLLLLAFYGFLTRNGPRIIVFDLITYCTVLGAFVLGRHDSVWRDIRTSVTILTAVSVVLAIRYTDARILTDRSILNEQLGSYFESVLTLVPLLCLVAAFERRANWYYTLLAISCGCLFVYMYFGRRGISVRCGLEIIFAAVLVPMLLRQHVRTVSSLALAGIVAVGLLLYFPFDVLIARYVGHYGVLSTVLVENDRWQEVAEMWQEFSALEVLVGRGMGGAFSTDQMSGLVQDSIQSGSYGRIATHAGFAMPVLKGGLVLWGLYFAPLFFLISRLPRWRRLDHITVAAGISGTVLFAFQFIEGSVTYSSPWIGLGIGLVFSRAQNARWTSSGPARRATF